MSLAILCFDYQCSSFMHNVNKLQQNHVGCVTLVLDEQCLFLDVNQC